MRKLQGAPHGVRLVFGTGWLDVVIAVVMGSLGLWGGWQIVHQARGELLAERAAPLAMAEK